MTAFAERPVFPEPPVNGNGPGAADGLGPLASLVRLAVESDDSARLIAAAGAELRRPLGLVAATGETLGHAPDDAEGRRALAVAAAAARTPGLALPGWEVVPITQSGSRVGYLAGGGDGGDGGAAPPKLLELIAALLGEQLRRAALLRAQTATFLRRLVGDPGLDAESAREEAAAVGLTLASAYWPAVLAWPGAAPRAAVVARLEREVEHPAGALTATRDNHVVLLHPDETGATEPNAWFEQIVARARALARSPGAHAIAAERAFRVDELGTQVAGLLGLCGLGPRADPARPVVWARQCGLDRLLRDNLPAREAHGFVADRLGPLIAWDAEHRTDLLRVLEAALDFPRHDEAARRCFMHRNTFRHRLRQATRVLGDDIEDPDTRLAVHVALKLRRAQAPLAAGDRATPRRRA